MAPVVGCITVDSLAVAFLDHIQQSDHTHYHGCRSAVKILLQLYSGTTVDSFTPKSLAAVQYQFTQHVAKNGRRYCRKYCNDLVKYLKQMFRWGVAQELVSPITADALKYVPALQRGRTDAHESKPREDVPDEVVDATLPHLLPTVATMVQVQRWAVMRPNEVCRMRVGNIDMSRKDGIWLYCPPDHKGTWRGYGRIVPLGKPEQAIILPYLEGKTPEQAVFSPRTAVLEKHTNGQKRQVPNSKWKDQKHFEAKKYAVIIKWAIIVANHLLPSDQKIPHWTPKCSIHIFRAIEFRS